MKIGIISGASSGIGKAIAKELDSLGLDELWLIARSEERLNSAAKNIKTTTRCIPLDLTEISSFDYLNSLLSCGKYSVEYLVGSCGVGYTGELASNSSQQISNTIDLNCRGLTLLISTVLPYICSNGKIINIASAAGFLPQADFAVYAASKSYVISLSKAIRQELKPKRISVCAVCPGPVDTDFFANLENVKEYKKKYLITPEKVASGAMKAIKKNKAIFTPTLSIKLLHLCSKLIPSSLLFKFAK